MLKSKILDCDLLLRLQTVSSSTKNQRYLQIWVCLAEIQSEERKRFCIALLLMNRHGTLVSIRSVFYWLTRSKPRSDWPTAPTGCHQIENQTKFLPTVSRALRQLLLTLDNLVGYGFLQTKNGKLEDASSEKLDLITLCVSAIPRILPDGFKQYQTRNQIIKIISQLTIHQSKSLQDQSQGSMDRSVLILSSIYGLSLSSDRKWFGP